MSRPEEEARALTEHAQGDADALGELAARRLSGTPLPRLTGWTTFDGATLRVRPDVYIPRWTSEAIAVAAADLLPENGIAVDLCTGCGAIAASLSRRRPDATIVATDVDPYSVACAGENGVDARQGDLFDGLPHGLLGRVDVVAAVPPFVPDGEIGRLPAEVRESEPRIALDGGSDGMDIVRRIIADAPRWLRPDGALVVEVGAGQVSGLRLLLEQNGWERVAEVTDPDGDPCGVAARAPRGTL